MKTYEEKYKKALEWMREVYPTLQGAAKEDAEYYFPELKESGNIRIIKAIKYGLDHVFTNNTTVFEVTKEQCLAWLEKQGDKDKLIKELGEYKVKYTQEVLSQQLEKQSAHKSAFWSEEDEERYLSCLKRLGTGNIEQPETVNTVCLKSLKDRIQPQQEWSEEDEKKVNGIITILKPLHETGSDYDKYKNSLIAWLKSLRPQLHWKPSDEQVEALVSAIDVMIDNRGAGDKNTILLSGLYHKLKAL